MLSDLTTEPRHRLTVEGYPTVVGAPLHHPPEPCLLACNGVAQTAAQFAMDSLELRDPLFRVKSALASLPKRRMRAPCHHSKPISAQKRTPNVGIGEKRGPTVEKVLYTT